MSKMYEKIEFLCDQRGIKPGTVCRETGLSRGLMSDLKAGRTKELSAKNLKIIADYFGVSVSYFMEENAPTPKEGERKEYIRIPVLGSVPAGVPLEAIEDIRDWEDIPQSWAAGGKEYFGLEVEGDSMWPEYRPGDVVIVQRTPVCESGDDCIVYVNGFDATLKTVRLDPDNHSLTIVPINPQYPPRTFTAEEIRDLPVSIAGVVVEQRRRKHKK